MTSDQPANRVRDLFEAPEGDPRATNLDRWAAIQLLCEELARAGKGSERPATSVHGRAGSDEG